MNAPSGVILGVITTGLRHEFAEFRTEIKADLRATEQVGVNPRASNG